MKIYTGINMAGNLDRTHGTSVKFYSTLTRNLAKGLAPIRIENDEEIYVEPGAICFVSDSLGNSIFLNKYLFGGESSSGGGGGSGITEITLSDIVVVESNGQYKTLLDYFNYLGDVISDSFKVITRTTNIEGNEVLLTVVEINSDGITIEGSRVLTENDISTLSESVVNLMSDTVDQYIEQIENSISDYTTNLIGKIYTIKETVLNYAALLNLSNPQIGDVHNVIDAYSYTTNGQTKTYPPGTNFVYTESGWDSLGGAIDLSAYWTSSTVLSKISEALGTAKGYTDGEITNVNNSITTIRGNISSMSTQLGSHGDALTQHATYITNISTQLTWQ